MPQHAVVGGADKARRLVASLLVWHDSRPRASFDSPRGWCWAALIAATFFWMSNPLVFVAGFPLALDKALLWTTIALLVSLPWLRLPRVPWPWLLFLGLCLASQLWTINDVHTDISNRLYLELTVLAVVVAANCRRDVVAWGIAAGGAVVLALSLYALHQQLPGIEYVGSDGLVFAGVGTNENILAYTLTTSLGAVLAIGWPERIGARVSWSALLAFHGYGLYRAGSGTGYIAALILLVATALIVAWPRFGRSGHRVLLAMLALAGAALAGALWVVTTVLGKEVSTLSGRIPFWRGAIESTLDRAPFLGSGWGAVWEHPWDPTPPNEVAWDIYNRARMALSHGHNFFVDVIPELGFVGLAVVLIMVAYAVREVRRCGLHAGAPDPLAGRLILFVLVSLLAAGIAEPMLVVPLGWWSLALVAALPRQRELPPRRRERARGGRRIAEKDAALTSAP
jgi:O-antigen ligase